MPQSVEGRFWAKVDRMAHADECWLWTGTISGGYGRFHTGGSYVRAHRFAYEQLVGPIPDDLTLDHLCMVKACVNPAHLEPVTRGENARRFTQTITECPRGHTYTEETSRQRHMRSMHAGGTNV